MVCKFFDKKTGSGVSIDKQLAQELHKSVIKTFKRRKIYARFKENIQTADIAEMESLSSKKKKLNIYYVLQMLSLNMHGLSH